MERGRDNTNIDHPIAHLEDKVQFLRILQDTLVVSTNKVKADGTNHLSRTEEQIKQYEKAIEILKAYRGR